MFLSLGSVTYVMEPFWITQAYKTHHLYVLERWLKKYETVYPKGPVLGYCAGQPVFRRSSVQTLHTSDRWLREGRKVKPGELPAKVCFIWIRAVTKARFTAATFTSMFESV